MRQKVEKGGAIIIRNNEIRIFSSKFHKKEQNTA